MTNPLTIRKAEPHDRPALENCFCELQAFERSLEENRADPRAICAPYIDRLIADCEKYSGAIFVAECDATIVGFVCVLARLQSSDIAERDREYAYITDLVVLQAYRRTGVGTQLMKTAEIYATAPGAVRMQICVLAANVDAHRLYHQLGYCDKAVVLEKRLEQPSGNV